MCNRDEITRLCDRCQAEITRRDEERGQCPVCQGRLLSLVEWPPDALEWPERRETGGSGQAGGPGGPTDDRKRG